MTVEGMDATDDALNGGSLVEVESLVLRLLREGIPGKVTPEGPLSAVHRKSIAGTANVLAMALAYLTARYVTQDPAKLSGFDWNAVMRPILAQMMEDLAEAEPKPELRH